MLLAPPRFSSALSATSALCCVLGFSSVVYSVYFFFMGGNQSVQGGCADLSQGGWGILCDACLSPVWSAEDLPSMFGASIHWLVVWGWWPTCSLSVSWHGEDFHRLGVQGAKLSTLLGASPRPSVAPESQQGPSFMELTLSVSVSQLTFWILKGRNLLKFLHISNGRI
jgi:hypothetical protein